MSALFGFNANDRKQYHYILDNIIKNNGEYGIKINGKMTMPIVQSNIIENNHYGILIDSPVYNGMIDQNKLNNVTE